MVECDICYKRFAQVKERNIIRNEDGEVICYVCDECIYK